MPRATCGLPASLPLSGRRIKYGQSIERAWSTWLCSKLDCAHLRGELAGGIGVASSWGFESRMCLESSLWRVGFAAKKGGFTGLDLDCVFWSRVDLLTGDNQCAIRLQIRRYKNGDMVLENGQNPGRNTGKISRALPRASPSLNQHGKKDRDGTHLWRMQFSDPEGRTWLDRDSRIPPSANAAETPRHSSTMP